MSEKVIETVVQPQFYDLCVDPPETVHLAARYNQELAAIKLGAYRPDKVATDLQIDLNAGGVTIALADQSDLQIVRYNYLVTGEPPKLTMVLAQPIGRLVLQKSETQPGLFTLVKPPELEGRAVIANPNGFRFFLTRVASEVRKQRRADNG